MRRMLFAAAVVALLTIAGEALADGGWGQWIQMDPPDHPSRRGGGGMAYDSESDRVILFGGAGYTNQWFGSDETWAYDFNTDTWELMSPEDPPSPRLRVAMAYDSESDRVVLFGGEQVDMTCLGDTWAYDYNTDTWERMSPEVSPSARFSHGMAYDSQSDRMIMFGGGCHANGNDTWAYDYNTDTWEPMSPALRPSERVIDTGIAYDVESDRIIFYGGQAYSTFFGDTWAYDYETDTWEQLHPADDPGLRRPWAMAYDIAADRLLLFGGHDDSNFFDDTWAYDYNTDAWQQLDPADEPGPRGYHLMAYDSESDCVVLFGGYISPNICLDDTWAFLKGEFCAPRDWLWPYWNWISIPGVPDDPDPNEVLGFDCGGRLWYWDKYGKWHQVYRPPFIAFDLAVGDSYLLWLDEVPEPVSYEGTLADSPFEFKLGPMGWTWVGMPRAGDLAHVSFMENVCVQYPVGGFVRTAAEDYAWTPKNWLQWCWFFWDGELQAPRPFAPYLPFGHNTCCPWLGYRCWVNVGDALDEDDPDQVTLIWP